MLYENTIRNRNRNYKFFTNENFINKLTIFAIPESEHNLC